MTALQTLSVLLCASLTAVVGAPAPAAKQPFATDDALAGGEYLATYAAQALAPDDHHYERELNSVTQRRANDRRPAENIYASARYIPRPRPETSTRAADPTTVDDAPPAATQFDSEADPKEEEPTTKIVTEKVVEEKVISVRISSSVARHSHHRTPETTSTTTARSAPADASENLVGTLVTQEQPTLTAVQRSDLGVEEAAPSAPGTSAPEEVEGDVREVTAFGAKTEGEKRLPVFEIHYRPAPPAMLSNLRPQERRQEGDTARRKEFRQMAQFREPTAYSTAVSSPTSNTRVNFYREHARGHVHGAAETVQRPVISEPFAPAAYRSEEGGDADKSDPEPHERKTNRIKGDERRQNADTGSYDTEEHRGHAETSEIINENITPAALTAEDTQQESRGELTSYHDEPSEKMYGEPEKVYGEPEKVYGEPEKVYSEPAKVYGEPAKVYSEPAKVYSEPAKVYSEPAKVYGEPAKVYSEPAKVYGEPAKVYSEPAKVYSEPAKVYGEPAKVYGQPEVSYEVDEAASVASNGKAHGPQTTLPPANAGDPDKNKFGYVVEGENFRKYRVEERTADGFIVGEYGVVSHDDGSHTGVRYTADGTINPRLIYDTLVKFLSL